MSDDKQVMRLRGRSNLLHHAMQAAEAGRIAGFVVGGLRVPAPGEIDYPQPLLDAIKDYVQKRTAAIDAEMKAAGVEPLPPPEHAPSATGRAAPLPRGVSPPARHPPPPRR